MATALETAPAQGDVELNVNRIKTQRLKNAKTIGDYVQSLTESAKGGDGASLELQEKDPQQDAGEHIADIAFDKREEVQKRLEKDASAAKTAVKGNEDLHIDHSLTGSTEQGNAGVGAGRSTININPDAVKHIGANAKATAQAKNLFGHEVTHATKQKSIGNIRTSKGLVTSFDLLEWGAETGGAEEEGKDTKTFNREGQPKDYAHAQEQGKNLQELGVKEEELEGFIGKGDTEGLQMRVIEEELKQGKLDAEVVKREQAFYQDAVRDVLVEQSAGVSS